jgi:hypothetical protein
VDLCCVLSANAAAFADADEGKGEYEDRGEAAARIVDAMSSANVIRTN